MNLGDFHLLVSTSLRRGTTLDSYIPQQVELAAQWMERNYTMKYMESFRLLQIKMNQRTLKMPTNVLVKAAKFVRLIDDLGNYLTLNKVEPEDLLGVVSTQTAGISNPLPKSYYIVGLNTLVLDTIPAQDWTGESILYEYSDWPTELTTTHPLLQIAADMLLAQTQMFIAINIMKDLRMVTAYKQMRDEAVNTLTRAEDENKYGGESISMAYVPQ
jgi:hypothetical protein